MDSLTGCRFDVVVIYSTPAPAGIKDRGIVGAFELGLDEHPGVVRSHHYHLVPGEKAGDSFLIAKVNGATVLGVEAFWLI